MQSPSLVTRGHLTSQRLAQILPSHRHVVCSLTPGILLGAGTFPVFQSLSLFLPPPPGRIVFLPPTRSSQTLSL